MNPRHRHWPLHLTALAALGLVARYLDAIWSSQTDIAHHYSLVARLAEFWTLPPAYDISLGEMNSYPPLSHMMAALAGGLFGSPLLGMQIIALGALIALWASLIALLQSLPARLALPSAMLMAALLLVNRHAGHIALHGAEIVGNFFYAQLVAQALAALALLVCAGLERAGRPPPCAYLFLIACIAVINFTHLLPGLELLGTLLLLMAIEAATRLPGSAQESIPRTARRHGRSTYLAALTVLAALAVASVLGHPSLSIMHELGMYEGSLSFDYLPTPGALAWLCVAVLCGSAALLWRWFALGTGQAGRRFLALKYLGAYGMALALLCLAQLLAFRLGHGALYAAKKYVFALDSVALIELAILPFVLLPSADTTGASGNRHERGARLAAAADFIHACLLPLLLVAGVCCALPAGPLLSTARLVTLERQIGLLRDTVLQKTPGKFDYVAGLAGQRPGIDYLFSLGLLKAPRGGNTMSILGQRHFSEPQQVGTVISSENAADYDFPACRRHRTPGALVVLDGACVVAAMARDVSCLRTFDFTDSGDFDSRMLSGFSLAERHGRWTTGSHASFRCQPTRHEAQATHITIAARAFVPAARTQTVEISVNRGPPMRYAFSASAASRSIGLAVRPAPDGQIRIDFFTPGAIAPKALGLSDDSRQLALSVRMIELR